MFAKIVLDGQIIDAVAELRCCKFNKRSGLVLRCDKGDKPSGIISERTGEIYQVDGWPIFPEGAAHSGVVEIQYIDEEEYKALVEALKVSGPVAQPEPDSEIPPDATVEFVREAIIAKMSAACNVAITSGVDVVLSDGTASHFSLKLEDQMNLMSLSALLTTGAVAVPYHADGEECRYYSAADFQLIATTATTWKIYHESYFNSLRAFIRSMESTADILGVEYGIPIPEQYQTVVLRQMVAQMATQTEGA